MDEEERRLYNYVKDYMITKWAFQRCLKKTSKKLQLDKKYIVRSLLEKVRNIVQYSIKKAKDHDMELKSYQKLAVEYMAVNRGMIAAFDVGTGKTLTAVAIANCVVELCEFFNRYVKIIVITPTSLQKNFKKEMIAYGNNPDDKRYKFYTVTKFGIDYKAGLIDCSRTFFIVDEAHVFRKDYRNIFTRGPMRGKYIKDTRTEFALFCSTKAWKVLLLTATPMYNQYYDIVNLAAMIKGIYPPSDKSPLGEYSMDKKKFIDLYCDPILFQESDKQNYPSRINILIEIIMTDKYQRLYEILENSVGKTNIYDPDKLKNAFYIEMRKASNKLVDCLKCESAMQIIRRKQKTIFYSCFLSHGVEIIIEKLNKENIKYYLIDGSVPMKVRNRIIDDYNKGDSGIDLLLITKAGGEGLDLKEVRNVIIFERGWNFASEEQVIGRAIRYKSHVNLPEKERVVKVYYLMVQKQSLWDIQKYVQFKFPYLFKFVPTYSKIIYMNQKYMKEENYGTTANKTKPSIDTAMFINSLTKQSEIAEVTELLKQNQITKEKVDMQM